MANIETFQPTELLSIVFEYPDGTFAGEAKYMDGITISNGASEKELRSGVNNGVLYSISSDFTSDLSGECIMSSDLFKIITSNEATTGSHVFTINDIFTASGTTVLLPETPAAGGKMHVFPIDAKGRRGTALKLGTPASNAGDYSITGKNITIHSSLSGNRIKVVFEYEKEGTRFRKEAKDSNIFRVKALCKATDLETKIKHVGEFIIPAFKPSTSFDIAVSNVDFVKLTLTGKCLVDVTTNSSWDFLIQN